MKVIGRNPVVELCRSKYQVQEIRVQRDINQDEKISEVLGFARENDINIIESSRQELENLSEGEPHQGLIAFANFETPNFTEDDAFNSEKSFIYIREAQYEHNLGAIIRTAEVAGLAGVIIPPNHKVTPVVVRISMGAIFHIPIFTGSLFPTIKNFKKVGKPVYAIERNNNTTIYNTNFGYSSLVIIGGEDKSISPEVQEKCDQVLGIPQYGNVNSLNMSVAAGIGIFEHVRQFNQNQGLD